MADDEIEAAAQGAVRGLLRTQFPAWSQLPVHRFPSTGTDNVIFRLGDRLGVRMPRVPWAVAPLEREYAWLPRLAQSLPARIPMPVALGNPGAGYPWPWTVFEWVEGANPVAGDLETPKLLAADLADFIAAMRALDPQGAPATVWTRPLHEEDSRVQSALAALADLVDVATVQHAWHRAITAAPCGRAKTWIHGDLAPANVLVRQGRLHGVIDFSAMGLGDPASDLRPAWNLLGPDGRDVLRERLAVDDQMWSRGRGWVLLQSLAQLTHFRDNNLALAANAAFVLAQITAEVAAGQV